VTAFLYGSAVIALAASFIGLCFLAFEGNINGSELRRRDRVAARLITVLIVAAAWTVAAIGIGNVPR
jgi:hypothetical protein